MYFLSIDGSTEVSERTKLYPLIPRVVVWYKAYVDTIGNNVVLPCRAKGHPRPHVTWRDNKGNLVKNDSRMKVRDINFVIFFFIEKQHRHCACTDGVLKGMTIVLSMIKCIKNIPRVQGLTENSVIYGKLY